MEYYAHSTESSDESTWQELSEHLGNVAGRAAGFAEGFGAGPWGRAAGLHHDLGKGSTEFQNRLRGGRKVDHSTAGAQELYLLHGEIVGKLLAYAVCGHHGGIPDGVSSNACLEKRLAAKLPDCTGYKKQISSPPADITFPFSLEQARGGFELSFLTRMIFSCLVDADFLDTEAFIDPDKAAWRGNYPTLAELKARLDCFLEPLRAKENQSPLNKRRNQILDQCLLAAALEPGLFSLTVPTGGGKTISTLAFGLDQALRHGLRRIIYVIPYTSIIEQNAAVFRDILGDDAVVEHHSNLPEPPEDDSAGLGRAALRSRLASENWDAPLVVTTNVQFFESLFANKPSRARKLHNIANSVVILDEAQMLPRELLKPCMEALRELSTHYGASIVLCTATQPALNDAGTFKGSALVPREIIKDPAGLYEEFRRVRSVYDGKLSNDDLAGRIAEHEQALCILNTRADARRVYQLLAGQVGRESCFHLSALMYPAHRKAKLANIRQVLERGEPCRLVSTQLIEAGVDIDLPVVYRALAGIDSLAQAAGRCNREGRLPGKGRLHIFLPESGKPGYSLRAPADHAEEILDLYPGDPLSLEAVRKFFELLFWSEESRGQLDLKGILNDLEEGKAKMLFPFRSVAKKFSYIDSPGEAVFVCPDEGLKSGILEGLRYSPNPGRYARMAQPYTVCVYPYQLDRLVSLGVVERVGDMGFPVLVNQDAYDDELGLNLEEPDRVEPKSLIT